MGDPNADRLEKEYEAESRRAQGIGSESGVRTKVEMLPTLDARGRLYDVGRGGKDEDTTMPGNRRKKEPKVRSLRSADTPMLTVVVSSRLMIARPGKS
jgi:hypothetical protein